MVIYKYQLNIKDTHEILLPIGSKPLCVQVQYGVPCIWVQQLEPNPDKQITHENYIFQIIGTGHKVEAFPNYLGTIQMKDGDLVFHVFYKIINNKFL